MRRRWLLDFLKHHAAHVERIARGLGILDAAAVTVIGLLLFSGEMVWSAADALAAREPTLPAPQIELP